MRDLIPIVPLPVSVLLMLGCAARYWLRPEDRRRNDWLFLSATFIWPGSIMCYWLTALLAPYSAPTMDLYVDRFDQWFGHPAFVLGRLVLPHIHWVIGLAVLYGLMPVMIMLTMCILILRSSEQEAARAARTFMLMFLVILPVYILFPVCGPIYAFPSFPQEVPAQVLHRVVLDARHNGVPSGHFSSAALVFLFLRRWRAGFVFGIVYVAVMGVAILALGEHYLFDLFVSIPYIWVIWKLGKVEWSWEKQLAGGIK